MWKKDNSFEVKKMLDAQRENSAKLAEEQLKKAKELEAIQKALSDSGGEIVRLKSQLEENFENFSQSLDKYCQHLMKRIWQKDPALQMLEDVFIRTGNRSEFYYYRLFAVEKDGRSGEFYADCDYDTRSYLRSGDCRLSAFERVIVGENGVLVVEGDSGVDPGDAMLLLAYFYHEAKKKNLPAIIARVKEEIEKAAWENMKPGERSVKNYLFYLYFTPENA